MPLYRHLARPELELEVFESPKVSRIPQTLVCQHFLAQKRIPSVQKKHNIREIAHQNSAVSLICTQIWCLHSIVKMNALCSQYKSMWSSYILIFPPILVFVGLDFGASGFYLYTINNCKIIFKFIFNKLICTYFLLYSINNYYINNF